MSNPSDKTASTPDPMQFWREFYAQSEASWGKVLEQNMGSEAYSAMLGQTLEAYATLHTTLRENMNRYLETMNLPSREDFARVAAQVVALEVKIDAADEKLDAIQDRLGASDRGVEAVRATLKDSASNLTDLAKLLKQQGQKLEKLQTELASRDRKLHADLVSRDRKVETALTRLKSNGSRPAASASKRKA